MRKRIMTASIIPAVLAAALLFSSCGSGSAADTPSSAFSEDGGYSTSAAESLKYGDSISETDLYDQANVTADSYDDTSMNGFTSGLLDTDTSSETVPTDQKLVVTWSFDIQTEKYDDTVALIKNSVSEAGGYIESENESSYNENDRYASLTIRIPTEKADQWMGSVSDFGTIVSRSKSTEDITLNYVDTKSRLEALREEQTTLKNMMKKAENMTDLIAIQAEFTDVSAEIESYESQLRVMDNQVSYTTVYMNISEVIRESAPSQSLGEEIHLTFLNSIDWLGEAARGLIVCIIGNSVIIILAIAIIAAGILLRKKIRKRKDRTLNHARQKKPTSTDKKNSPGQEETDSPEKESEPDQKKTD